MAQRVKLARAGISLMELMIALTIFAVFGTTFISGVGLNVFNSSEMREDIVLLELAEMKLNELVIDPPPLGESLLEQSDDPKSFEDFPEYTYEVKIKKFILPDLSKLLGEEEEEREEDSGLGGIKSKVYEVAKNNIEKMVWQVEVIVQHKSSGRRHSFSTWLHDHRARVSLGGL